MKELIIGLILIVLGGTGTFSFGWIADTKDYTVAGATPMHTFIGLLACWIILMIGVGFLSDSLSKYLTMKTFIQNKSGQELTTEFYTFLSDNKLNYESEIKVIDFIGNTIYKSIKVKDYLKKLPE